MDIREQITNTSTEVAPPVEVSPIETPVTTPTVEVETDSNTDIKSEQATPETNLEETVQSPKDETPEVKENVTKEDRLELGKKVEKKIGKLTKAKAEANAKADNALKRLKEAEAVIAKLKGQEVDIDAMSFDERIKHSVDSQLAESRANDAIATANDDLNASGEGVWQTKLDAAQTKHSDYAKVVGESNTPMKPDVATAIKESDLGAEMVYQIAKNPELGQELYRASPMRAAMILHSLEQSIGSSNSVLTEQTPAPVIAPTPTLNATPTAKPAQSQIDMGMEDFMAHKANLRKKAAGRY